MSREFDPYSLPMPPAWVGKTGGERFTVGNRTIREPYKIPRAQRALEITCGRSVVAVVFPRGKRRDWRLQILDVEQHLLPQDDPSEGQARFKCVCGRLHVLDRDAVLEAAGRLEPKSRSGPARRIDFRRVARVIRGS